MNSSLFIGGLQRISPEHRVITKKTPFTGGAQISLALKQTKAPSSEDNHYTINDGSHRWIHSKQSSENNRYTINDGSHRYIRESTLRKHFGLLRRLIK